MKPIHNISLILVSISNLTLFGMAEEDKSKADPFAADEYEDDSRKVFPDPAGKTYFPEGKARYYTRYFLAMKEPSIQAELPEGTTFVLRFSLLPSFTDNLVVRIYDKDGKFHARAVRQKKDRNYNPVQIKENRNIALDQDFREKFQALLANGDFWNPLSENEEGMQGFDGARWIFEIKNKSGYHMLDLWSPDNERRSDEMLRQAGFDPAQIRDFRPYVQAALQLLELAKLKPEDMEPD